MRSLINLKPGRGLRLALGLAPFLLLGMAYLWASHARLALNAQDKLLPSLGQFGTAIDRFAFEPSRRTGELQLWGDTAASLGRLGVGVLASAVLGLVIGIVMGALPLAGAGLSPLVASLSLIPPLALLPILFIVFGLGEVSKVMLIVIGITPVIARDIALRVREIPRELIVKAQTLGAGSWQVILRVVVPLTLPRLVSAVRLALGAAWLFLIAAEAIAAESGLGYRIFLVRRYLAMDVILPYVVWITLLALLTDLALAQLSRRLFRWSSQGQMG
jgi:NitT/TauT family transport system permease protein